MKGKTLPMHPCTHDGTPKLRRHVKKWVNGSPRDGETRSDERTLNASTHR